MLLRFRFASFPVALLLPLSAASAQKQTDLPLRITLHETAVLSNWDGTAVAGAQPATSAVVGDGNDVYTNGQTLGATINSPNSTSLTAVLPQPYNCSQAIYPSWLVRGTLPNTTTQPSYLQVSTLLDQTKGVTAGQFSLPFELLVEALQCFNPGY
jgi:hypothetical protein